MHVTDNTIGAEASNVIDIRPQQKQIEFKAKHAFEMYVINLTAYAPTNDIGPVAIETTITYPLKSVDFAVDNAFGLRVKVLTLERGEEEFSVMTKDPALRRALVRCQDLASHLFKTGLVMMYYPSTGSAS